MEQHHYPVLEKTANSIPNSGQVSSKALQSKAKKSAVESVFALAGARQVVLALSCPCKMPVQELLLPCPAQQRGRCQGQGVLALEWGALVSNGRVYPTAFEGRNWI